MLEVQFDYFVTGGSLKKALFQWGLRWVFPKIGVGKTLFELMIWGYLSFWKHPYSPSTLLGTTLKLTLFDFQDHGIPFSELSNEKNPGWLGYIGDYTPQLY